MILTLILLLPGFVLQMLGEYLLGAMGWVPLMEVKSLATLVDLYSGILPRLFLILSPVYLLTMILLNADRVDVYRQLAGDRKR